MKTPVGQLSVSLPKDACLVHSFKVASVGVRGPGESLLITQFTDFAFQEAVFTVK